MNRAHTSAVFVTGLGRSGTSLAISLLDGHPDLLVLPVETKFFAAVQSGRFEDYILKERCFAQFDWPRGLTGGAAPPCSKSEVYEAYRANLRGGGLRERFLAIVAAFDAHSNRDRPARAWVEKTPAHWEFYPLLTQWFGARFVHLYRDPRDVFASTRRLEPGWSVESFCRRYRRMYVMVEEYAQRRDNVLTVRYEDIVRETAATMSRVARFLGIPMIDRVLLTPTVLGQPFRSNSSYDAKPLEISTGSIGKFATELSDREIGYIEHALADMMVQYGYATTPARINRASLASTVFGAVARTLVRAPRLQIAELKVRQAIHPLWRLFKRVTALRRRSAQTYRVS